MIPQQNEFNDEDLKIWDCLENLQIKKIKDSLEFKMRLFVELQLAIGKCSRCIYWVPKDCFCNNLKVKTAAFERCSDFEPVEEETETAFDIMTEEFRKAEEYEQKIPKILKYKRNKKKEINLGGVF